MPPRGKKPTSPWIDWTVRTADGKPYGKIVGVYEFGAGEVFDIEKHQSKKIEMLPLNERYLKQVPGEKTFIVEPFEFTEATPEKP